MQRNPLNAVDGNNLTIPIDDKDLYHCKECDGDVPEDEWNNKRSFCYKCWWKI